MEGPSNNSDQYFASEPGDEVAGFLLARANKWYNHIFVNGLLNRIRDSWIAYHGAYLVDDIGQSHKIHFGGEAGELAQIAINHYRNLAQHLLAIITATRPAMQARSINTDYKSVIQTKLANGLLDYYMREKKLEKYLKTAVEYAIVLSAGYIKVEWDANSGKVYDYNEDTKSPIYEGDIKFSNLSPLDVVFDSTKETPDQDWVLTRTFKNKYDLIAKFPDRKEDILGLPTKSELYNFRFNFMYLDETDDIPVYEFYHKRTDAMEDGRYMLFLSDDVVLIDLPMPYRQLPVYRITCGDILGTPYGYTPMFDVLPLQDAINALYTTVLSNNNATGLQTILMPRGTDINPQSLTAGLTVLEYNAQAGEPKALQLTASSPETYKLIEMFEKVAETLTGISSVARGNPEPSLKSGTALAMVQSMSLQFSSGLQQSYVQLIEDLGTGIINILKDYATVPRVAAIVGESNKCYMEEFTGDDLDSINRVVVDVGNPLAATTAGKVEMATQLLQMKLIETPEQYLSIINSGKLEVATENTERELFLIRDENEQLMRGEQVIATAIDEHLKHIKEHRGVIADTNLRKNPTLVQNTLDHIQEHVNFLRQVDPALLTILGEQPLGPAGGSPASPQPPQAPPQGSGQQMGPTMAPNMQPAAQPTQAQLPKPPGQFQNLPVTAQQKGMSS